VSWEELNGETLMEYGLKGLVIDDKGFSGATGYGDYEGDRIALQSYRAAAWDEELGDIVAITDEYINIPDVMPELEVSSYTPENAGPGWYIP